SRSASIAVPLLRGRARLLDADTVELGSGRGRVRPLTAKSSVLATGSRPCRPEDGDFNRPRIFDSDTILSLDYTPRSIIIYGAGTIGCEYASIFRGLGVKVDLINTRDRLLSFLDDEISDALCYHLRDLGLAIR